MSGRNSLGYEIPRVMEEWEIKALLWAAEKTRYPFRNRLIVLLGTDAGLTCREISLIKRYNVLTDEGVLGDHIDLLGLPSKYLKPRKIPMTFKGRLWWALHDVLKNAPAYPHAPLIISERALDGGKATAHPDGPPLDVMRPSSIGYIFWKLCDKAGIYHHAGRGARNTFIYKAGKKAREVGASLRDVQILAGHASLQTTQHLFESTEEARKKIVYDLFDEVRR